MKQFLLVFGPDADAGIHDADCGQQPPVFLALAEFEAYAPLLGKLDGIVGQIDKDLAEGAMIGPGDEVCRRNLDLKFETFGFRQRAQGSGYFLDYALTDD